MIRFFLGLWNHTGLPEGNVCFTVGRQLTGYPLTRFQTKTAFLKDAIVPEQKRLFLRVFPTCALWLERTGPEKPVAVVLRQNTGQWQWALAANGLAVWACGISSRFLSKRDRISYRAIF